MSEETVEERVDPPNEETRGRLWQHALHEETVFNDRLNFFLLAEAMLLVFFATGLGHVTAATLSIIALLGLILTLLWVWINVRQAADLRHAVARMRKHIPDYERYHKEAASKRRVLRGSALPILSFWVPGVVAAIWLALLVEFGSELVGG